MRKLWGNFKISRSPFERNIAEKDTKKDGEARKGRKIYAIDKSIGRVSSVRDFSTKGCI